MKESKEPDMADIIIEVLEGRRDFYLALAGFYFKPLTQEQIDSIAQTDYSAFGADEPLLEAGFNDITRYLRKRHSGTRQMLAIDFTSSFGGTQSYKGRVAAPYASVFLSEEGLLSQAPRAKVFKVFKRNCVRVVDENTPDDHLSFMLEFLAVMSERAAEALSKEEFDEVRTCLEESRDFINEHILTWFKDFEELANLLIEARFYRGVLRVTEGYLRMDLETINDILEEMQQL